MDDLDFDLGIPGPGGDAGQSEVDPNTLPDSSVDQEPMDQQPTEQQPKTTDQPTEEQPTQDQALDGVESNVSETGSQPVSRAATPSPNPGPTSSGNSPGYAGRGSKSQ